MIRRRFAAVLIALLATSLSREGGAQTAASAQAEELFQQGRRAFEAHDYTVASEKLAESLRIEPAVGTLISLAECEEARGRLASAREYWEAAAELADAKRDPLGRAPFARGKLAAIDVRLGRLVVRFAMPPPDGASVELDGARVPAAVLGVEVPLDPGVHSIIVGAPGHETKRYPLEIAEGQHKTLEVQTGPELLEARPAEGRTPTPASSENAGAPRPLPGPAATSGGTTLAGAPSAPPRRGASTQQMAAYVAGGAGLVGVAVGAYLGAHAITEWSKAKNDCQMTCGQGSAAQNEQADAARSADGSTIAFVAGGASLAAALVLWVTSPSTTRSEPTPAMRVSIAPTTGSRGLGVTLQRSW